MQAVPPAPQLMPPGVEATTPPPLTTTFSGAWIGVKVAEMRVAAVSVTLQTSPFALGQSVQLAKLQPAAGRAVRATGVPQSKEASQVAPQSTPAGSDVTQPEPV